MEVAAERPARKRPRLQLERDGRVRWSALVGRRLVSIHFQSQVRCGYHFVSTLYGDGTRSKIALALLWAKHINSHALFTWTALAGKRRGLIAKPDCRVNWYRNLLLCQLAALLYELCHADKNLILILVLAWGDGRLRRIGSVCCAGCEQRERRNEEGNEFLHSLLLNTEMGAELRSNAADEP